MAQLSLRLDPAMTECAAEASVAVVPALRWHPQIVPKRYVAFDVEPWWVASGWPVADSDAGIVVDVTLGVGDFRAVATFPDPQAVDTGATARWLPDTDTFTPAAWSSSNATGRMDLVAPDVAAPQLLLAGTYWRAGSFVQAPMVSLDDGEYLRIDAPAWSADEISALLVVVLRRPRSWYGVLESSDVPTRLAEDSSYLGLRYAGDGVLSLHSTTTLAQVRLATGERRTLQPVIVGFTASLTTGIVRLCAVDTAAHVITARLPAVQPYDAALYVGRSPSGGEQAAMEILEMDYWIGAATDAEVATRMAALDRIYGVTT